MTPGQQAVIDGILRGERYREIADRECVTQEAIEMRARRIAEDRGYEMCGNTPGAIREAILRARIAELESFEMTRPLAAPSSTGSAGAR